MTTAPAAHKRRNLTAPYEPPHCPACLGAAVARIDACAHCPKCLEPCRLDCHHCGGQFRAYPRFGGWQVLGFNGPRMRTGTL